ncbi:DsbA family oxidoreductase [Heyndrickxia ginsengihumi]|uniref:DsbA family oxidoreductase n=1 Tax=Heyndrickxia ginsengihumi TaxID=363870 RepID=UPI003D204D30
MKIEVWSDFSCPFCYIGKQRLGQAIDQFGHHEQIQIEFHSFELDKNAPTHYDEDFYSVLSAKFGITREEAIQMNQSVIELAKSVGLYYQLDTAIPTNTFDAHRLSHFARQYGKQKEMVEAIFRAHFIESKHIGDLSVLLELAVDIGLDRDKTKEMLCSKAHEHDVRNDEETAPKIGVNAVPFVVINHKYAITGAQTADVFLQALHEAWREETYELQPK